MNDWIVVLCLLAGIIGIIIGPAIWCVLFTRRHGTDPANWPSDY